jgi:hypothetical protein
MAAGYLLRRHKRVLPILLPYLELYLGGGMLLLLVVFYPLVFWMHLGLRPDQLPILALLPPALFALVAVLREWPWPLRLLVYAIWLFALLSFSEASQQSVLSVIGSPANPTFETVGEKVEGHATPAARDSDERPELTIGAVARPGLAVTSLGLCGLLGYYYRRRRTYLARSAESATTQVWNPESKAPARPDAR